MQDVFVVVYKDLTDTFELEREFECADEARLFEIDLVSKGHSTEMYLRFYG